MNIQNPAPSADLSPADGRVQPDGPLSGEVKRGGAPSLRYQRHLAAKKTPAASSLRGSALDGVVYLIQAATLRLVKIGMTLDLHDRLKTLQVGSPDKLTVIGIIQSREAVDLERRLHAMFRDDWSHGEWFRPTDRVLALAEEWSVTRYGLARKADLRAAMERAYHD